ncbi:MAG: HEAT repeat domain-containing protein, partial [Ktedonobacteraceae bacterium]
LLGSLRRQVRVGWVPEKRRFTLATQILSWLDQETDDSLACTLIEILGDWGKQKLPLFGFDYPPRRSNDDVLSIGMALIERFEASHTNQKRELLSMVLAHLLRVQPALIESVESTLLRRNLQEGAAALACLYTAAARVAVDAKSPLLFFLSADPFTSRNVHYDVAIVDTLLMRMKTAVPNQFACFTALLEAGSDEDSWDDNYHGILVIAAWWLIVQSPDSLASELLEMLLERLERALVANDWPTGRIALAIVEACAETMPTMLWNAGQGRLEMLLIKGATEANSFSSRRFALTALSYLRRVTASIIPALLAACQDNIGIVQKDAVASTSRFQSIEGDLLSELLPALTGPSVRVAYAVAQLLGALGTSAAGMSAGLSERIITALVQALKDPKNQRNVIIAGQNKGTLENTLYEVLLRVAGWIG